MLFSAEMVQSVSAQPQFEAQPHIARARVALAGCVVAPPNRWFPVVVSAVEIVVNIGTGIAW